MTETVFTRSGHKINIGAPRKDLILARDIAEQLAKMPMYRGACLYDYKIAHHSVLVAKELARTDGPLAAMYALLHHAYLTYLDNPQPSFMTVLHGAFDLDWPAPVEVQTAFRVAHDTVEMTELRHLCAGREIDVAAFERKNVKPLRGGLIKPLPWDRAMDRFTEALRVNAVAADLSENLPVWGEP